MGTKRYDSTSGGEREIQRTMLELLNQMDGFDARGDVKVIMATNRIETLDPALLRPGRIDRKIEFPLPDAKTKRRIFNIHVSRMSLADDVKLEEFVMSKDELSGADIKAMCTEAGLLALRERRMKVREAAHGCGCGADAGICRARAQITHADFKKAKDKVRRAALSASPVRLLLRCCVAVLAAAGALQEEGGRARGAVPVSALMRRRRVCRHNSIATVRQNCCLSLHTAAAAAGLLHARPCAAA